MNEVFADRSLFLLAIKFLGLAFVTGCVAAYYSRERSVTLRWQRLELVLAAVAWGMLSWALFVRGADFGRLPLSNVFEVFQALGWTALFFVVFLRAVWALRVPVLLGTGAALGLCWVGSLNAKNWDNAVVAGEAFTGDPWVGVHATLATIGYACFSAASTVWLVYLLQDSALRKRCSHPFFAKLPDLNSLDRIAGRLCAAGIVILGTGMLVGIASIAVVGEAGSWFVVYKTLISVAVLIGFWVLLALRRRGNISALKFARIGLGVFAAALVLFSGSACIKKQQTNEPSQAECFPAGEVHEVGTGVQIR